MMKLRSLQTVTSRHEHANFEYCKTQTVQHTCSFITGALIEQIH